MLKANLVKVLSHSGIYAVGTVTQSLLNIILVPLYTRAFSVEDFGILAVMASVRLVVGLLAKMGLENGFFIAYYEEPSIEKRRLIFRTAFFMSLLSGSAIAAATWLGSDALAHLFLGSSSRGDLFRWIGPLVLGENIFRMALQDLRSQDRAGTFTSLMALKLFLSLAGILAAVSMEMGLEGVLIGELVGMSASLVLVLALVARDVLPEPPVARGAFLDADSLRRLLRVCPPLIPAALASWVLTASDRVLLTWLGDATATGVYDLAVRFGSLVSVFLLSPFALAWGTLCFQIAQGPGPERTFRMLLTYLVLAVAWASAIVSIFSGDIILLMTTSRYLAHPAAVPMVCAGYIIYSLNVFWTFAPAVRGRSIQFLRVNVLGAALNAVLCVLAIPEFSYMGALSATLVANLVMTALMYRYAQQNYAIDYEWGRLARILLSSALFVIVTLAVSDGFSSIAERLVVKALATLIFTASFFGTGFFHPWERATMGTALRRAIVPISRMHKVD